MWWWLFPQFLPLETTSQGREGCCNARSLLVLHISNIVSRSQLELASGQPLFWIVSLGYL